MSSPPINSMGSPGWEMPGAVRFSYSIPVLRGLPEGRVGRGPLGLGDHELAADQLDGLAGLEDAEVDQLLVLDPGPAAGAGLVGCPGRQRCGPTGARPTAPPQTGSGWLPTPSSSRRS